MEICFRKQKWHGWCGKNSHCYIALCNGSLERKISIPERIKKIYAVFTKHKTEDSFTIVANNEWIETTGGRIKEYSGTLTFATRAVLGIAYYKGYRYVHFEY